MRIRERIANMIGGKSFEENRERERKVIKSALGSIEDDDWTYRKLTDTINRELSPLKQDLMIRYALNLYDNNGMAHRIIEMKKDFIYGEGIKYKAEDADVQKVLDKFWDCNLMDIKLERRVMELGLFGEQCYPVFVNEHDGSVKIGYLDPGLIDEVIANPQNIEDLKEVKLKSSLSVDDGFRTYKIIKIDEDPQSKTFGKRIGEAFFFAVNNVTTAKRGRSDLLSLRDWIYNYEQYLFNRLLWSRLANIFLYDVTFEGGSEEEIKKLSAELQTPKPNSIRIHNEKIKWDTIVPKLEAADMSEEVKMFRSHILAQAGFPPPWFAAGEGVTRATALEMSTPTYKMLKSRQNYVKYMIEDILNFVIDQAIIHKKIREDVNRKFTLFFPKLVDKDFSEIATAISSFTNALVSSISENLISKDTARTILYFLYSQIGMEIIKDKEDKDIQEDGKRLFDEFKRKLYEAGHSKNTTE